jgi:methylmalonyl-CoA mutase C-terminal domain/subunit
MEDKRKIRVLMGKLGLDCHDTGISTFAHLFREQGFEVVYMGLHNTAEEIYESAIQEGVDVIGVSFLSGQHLPHMRKLMKLIKEKDGFMVIVGGVIPKADIAELEKMGVGKVFLPGTKVSEAVDFVREHVGRIERKRQWMS